MSGSGSDRGAAPVRAADLTLDEQLALTGGVDLWHTHGVPRLGIDGLRLTDGPAGARGTRFAGDPAVSLPCPTALGASWDRELASTVGRLLAAEARRKGADVLLAPTVNLHRDPRGGRHFECYSEDPFLTAELAVAYIEAVQAEGVGCAVKHFVANDQETERMSVSVEVDEAPLRELYLLPFEAAVRRAGAWLVMAAYNRLAGVHCSQHHRLLTTILREEWGFDGVVVSDWFGTHAGEAVAAGLDLEMPGPPRHLGPKLAAAVESGEVPAAAVERAADRMLALTARAQAGRGRPLADLDGAAVARTVAARGTVLLANDGTLPLAAGAGVGSIAVLGPKAARPDTQGGGSARVESAGVVTPLAGIEARAAAAGVRVVHEAGVVDEVRRTLDRSDLRRRGTDEPGIDVHHLRDGEVVRTDRLSRSGLYFIGPPVAGEDTDTTLAEADLVPDRDGTWRFTFTSAGRATVTLDGTVVIDNTDPTPGESFYGTGSAPVEAGVDLVAGHRYHLVIELDTRDAGPWSIRGVQLDAQPPPDPTALDRAVAAAAEADVAVVVAGMAVADSEGGDRASIDLPDDQVRLIEAVADANPRTVVVLNTGAPVTTPWRGRAAALLAAWYGGQEAGHALADVLFGDVDPGGRLPTTWPERLDDVPAVAFPIDGGVLRYGDGLLVGYRHADRHGVEPAFCFGHGLSYTTFDHGPLDVRAGDDGTVVVATEVTNTGPRPGSEVVQLYVAPPDEAAPPERPAQELRQFARVELEPGASAVVELPLDRRAFARWDVDRAAWWVDGGTYELRFGSSSRRIHHRATVEVAAGEAPPF